MDQQLHQMPLNNEQFQSRFLVIPCLLFFFLCLISVVWSDNKANFHFLYLRLTFFFLCIYIRKEKTVKKIRILSIFVALVYKNLSFFHCRTSCWCCWLFFFSSSISLLSFFFFSIWPENNINETINSYGNMFCFQFHFYYRFIFVCFLFFPSNDYIRSFISYNAIPDLHR
jgi:hypothetical protein